MTVSRPTRAPRRALLVGNPNVGKSVLFQALTGRFAVVSNYPGTTVEVIRGTARTPGGPVEVIDTPGVNSLVPSGEDEAVTRDIVLAEPDAAILLVADAKNLRRGLALALQLLELGRPFALVLNMLDEARSRGIQVDAEALARQLGVPVISTVAIEGRGVGRLLEVLGSPPSSPPRPAEGVLPAWPAAAEPALRAVAAELGPSREGAMGLAAQLLTDRMLAAVPRERATGTLGLPAAALDAAARERRRLGDGEGGLAALLAAHRLRAADALVGAAVCVRGDEGAVPAAAPACAAPSGRSVFSAAVWRVLVAAMAGYLAAEAVRLLGPSSWPAAAVWLVWGGVTLLGAAGLSLAGRRRERRLADGFGRAAIHPLGGILVLAAVLYLVYRFVGVLGAQTLVGWLERDLFGGIVNPWLVDVCSAIPWRLVRELFVGPYGLLTMALTYAVAIVLPIVGTFFVSFAVLEDSGYLPRLAVMVDRLFRVVGLNGKAVLPMVLGLGCDTMATLTTRILETRKERILATFLLALGIPCSAQLGVVLAMLSLVGFGLGLVWFAAVLLTMVAAGFVASKLIPGERSDFLMELPPIRRPQLVNVVLKTSARLEWYLKEAVPLFALGTLVLFVLAESGALEWVRRAGEPIVVHLLGLPREAAEAFLIGFLRRDFGATRLFDMARAGALTHAQMVVAMVTITLFVPCIANAFMIWKERGWRVALAVVGVVFSLAFLVGGVVRALLAVL
jgi:ferrous iron transport protein B